MGFFGRLAAAAVVSLSAVAVSAETPVLRASVLEFGTVNWELDTIGHYGLDADHGFDLQVQGVAGGSAAQVAFQGGEADVIVSDWLWVARQRAAGKDYVFIPYSKAVGGVIVAGDSDIGSITDLAGEKIGIAGGPLDKSWLILQAYAAQQGLDLAGETEQVYGAPPLIFKTALDGDIAGAINYWHFMAKMEAAGMRRLISVAEAAEALGLDPDTPLLGYVVKGELLEAQPDLVRGLADASRAAKDLLAEDDAAWDRLRPRMRVDNDTQFEALKAGFREGIPEAGPVDEAAAARMLELMVDLGGPELLGEATTLPEGTFLQPAS
ncbi:ABC transporter substrate-binding protein [Aestuariibius sp. 2305UL40-4]|uniref:ABC transporter substrate-binding protein n=1 Tax=Aestuariibius violaceus TaxID=3234132 RepID=UPI00345E1C72